MNTKKKLLAIVGSTRLQSSNLNLLKAIKNLVETKVAFEIFDSIVRLPHFNPDDILVPAAVIEFRKAIDDADGVIICTPEYAHGVPGSLKNAIDWTVSTNQFSDKTTCLITASTDGQYGHKALLETLKVLEANHIDELQMVVPFIQTKVNSEGDIIDVVLKEQLILLIQKMIDYCTEVNQQ
jgi:chromate reductase, NAD(P)H dehydrogenase (quinone)